METLLYNFLVLTVVSCTVHEFDVLREDTDNKKQYELTNSSKQIPPVHILNSPQNATVMTASTEVSRMFEGMSFFDRFLATEKIKLFMPLSNGTEKDFLKSQTDKDSGTWNCSEDIQYVISSVRTRNDWALKMIDAAGKPGSGVLRDNVHFVGDFDECMDVRSDQHFQGRYCLTHIRMSKVGNTTFSSPIKFAWGLCVPGSCDATDVEEVINEYIRSHPDSITAGAAFTNCHERHRNLSTKAKIVICVCLVFATILAVATAVDVIPRIRKMIVTWQATFEDLNDDKSNTKPSDHSKQMRSESEPIFDPEKQNLKSYGNVRTETEQMDKRQICRRFVMSFSVYTNTSKLLSTQQSPDSIDSIHGIRFISITWVMLFHLYSVGYYGEDNTAPYLKESYARLTFMAVPNGVIAVDTFFAISGLLMSYLVFKQLSNDPVTPRFFGNFYFHRFWSQAVKVMVIYHQDYHNMNMTNTDAYLYIFLRRLTPPYMLILMTYVPLFPYISNGPLWKENGFETDECENTWWTNLLYINNFVKDTEECMCWSWYLANDMQFFLISPLLYLPMLYYEWKGLAVPLVFLVANAICAGAISAANDLGPVQHLENIAPGTVDNYFSVYYIKPYTRIGPYIIGVITGYLLFRSKCKIRIPSRVVLMGWIAATATGLAIVYGPFEDVKGHWMSTSVAALYNGLHRIGWGVCVCWVIFACANGYGGFVNTVLSWKALVPLSRLTYCAYLVHPMVIAFFIFSQRRIFYLNNINTVFLYPSIVMISYAAAYIAAMAYEFPMVGLEKAIRHRRQRTS